MTRALEASPASVRSGRAAWLARALWVLTLALVAAGYALLAVSRSVRLDSAVDLGGRIPVALFALAFSSVGARVAARRPHNAIGWLFIATGLAWAGQVFAPSYVAFALLAGHGWHLLGEASLWLQNWIWLPAVALPATFGLLLFPDGRLPSRRWRPVAWTAGAGIALASLGAFAPGNVENFSLENPYAVTGTAGRAIEIVASAGVVVVIASAAASATALIVRFRRATGAERQQLKWIAYAAALIGIAFPVTFAFWNVAGEWAAPFQAAALIALPICAGIAILRYRLYDIDLLVNRTLVYGALTAGVVGVYAGTVELVSMASQHQAGLWASAAATTVVIVLVQPLRSQLQRRVNSLMYGDRDDPYSAISRLGQRLQTTLAPEAVPRTVVETVAQALHIPFVAIELERGGVFESTASYGHPTSDRPLKLPLVHQGETLGALILAHRAPREKFSTRDQRLLHDLARQTGIAVHAVRLTAELQQSRQRLVSAREEERRRIRRDLHDGLGPTLAGITLNLGAARNLLRSDPARAEELFDRLQAEAQAALADIRHLVYELRPPALDELGLVGALREQAAQLGSREGTDAGSWSPQLRVSVDAPDELPPLPAAVEVAGYRIALEALTNAARHAEARTCTIRIATNGALELEITDDGRGLDPAHPVGVGLTSMRERAEELGGTCTVEVVPTGGTRVHASLPLAVP